MNNIITLLDKYGDSIKVIRPKLELSSEERLDQVLKLTMSMKHRIELIQHLFENIQSFNWEKLYNFDFLKDKEGKLKQELNDVTVTFCNEKLMGNYLVLFLTSLITLYTGLVDSLALLLDNSFLLNLEYVSIDRVQKKIGITALQNKIKEMILEDNDYRALKIIRKELIHFNLSNVIVYSDVKTEPGPGVRYTGVPMIHQDLLKGIDAGQRRVPTYTSFVHKKITQILEDILTTTMTL